MGGSVFAKILHFLRSGELVRTLVTMFFFLSFFVSLIIGVWHGQGSYCSELSAFVWSGHRDRAAWGEKFSINRFYITCNNQCCFAQPLVHCAEKRKRALEIIKPPLVKTDIDFISGSVFTTKWEDGDLVFCHGTCFSDQDWAKVSIAAEKLKQGAFFVSTTHVLRTGLFEVVKSLNFPMSWGSAIVYIHRRRKIGRWAAQMLRGGRSTRTDLLQQQPDSRQTKEGQAIWLRSTEEEN